MTFLFLLFHINILFFLFKTIYNFYVLPIETIFIKNKDIQKEDYYNILFQNELYTNLSIGEPRQTVKSLIKMDGSGFLLYNGSYNYCLSSTVDGIEPNLEVYVYYPLKDYFFISSFSSYNEFETYLSNLKNLYNESNNNTIRTNKTLFVITKTLTGYDNKNFYNFGIIGLKLNKRSFLYGLEFITSFKQSNDIKSYTFSFKFDKENYTYKNYFNNYNNGYLIFGEELKDDEIEKEKIMYTDAQKSEREINWRISFNKIYTIVKNKNNYIDFIPKNLGAEFIVNLPYLIGTYEYLDYINKTFFNELITNKLCFFNIKDSNKKELYSFICDGKSQNLIYYINNQFPDLVFEHIGLEEKFILTKNDLFSYNIFNELDTNIYFLVLFPSVYESNKYYNWTLGLPFLKKYRLSFNCDTKKIGYFKEIEKNITVDKEYIESNNNIFLKVIFIVLLVFIIFILGMLCQRKIIKIPRKIKANELDDNYEYTSYNNINKDINKNDKNKKEFELGFKFNI